MTYPDAQPRLTRRELEVLALVAYGYSAKEIAAQLGIAPRTIERHTENVRLKLRARNRAHLVTLAALHGYLQIGPPPEQLECRECLFRPSRSGAAPLLVESTAAYPDEEVEPQQQILRIVGGA